MDILPRLVLDGEAVDVLFGLRPESRRRVIEELERLRHEPPRETEDFAERDGTGRHVSVKAIRPVMIRYWLDGAVNELRIISISVVRPWK